MREIIKEAKENKGRERKTLLRGGWVWRKGKVRKVEQRTYILHKLIMQLFKKMKWLKTYIRLDQGGYKKELKNFFLDVLNHQCFGSASFWCGSGSAE